MSKKKATQIENDLPKVLYVEKNGDESEDFDANTTLLGLYSESGISVDEGENTIGVYKLVEVIRCRCVETVKVTARMPA